MGKLARQASLNFVLTYMGLLLGFINTAILYPRILPDDHFGLTRLLVSIATMAGAFAQLGLDNTIVRYFPYFRNPSTKNNGLLTLVLVIAFAGSLIAMLFLGAFHPWVARIFGGENGLYAVYGLFSLPLVLSEVFFLVLRGYSRSLQRSVKPTFLREFVLRALQTGLIGAQAYWQFPLSLFIALFTATFLICTIWLFIDLTIQGERLVPWKQVRVPQRLRSSMVRFSAYTVAASIASVVLGSMDQLMIGALLGSASLTQVGYYAVAFNFGAIVSAPMRALGQLGIPLLAEAWKHKDLSAIQRLYTRSVSTQFTIAGYLFLLLWVDLRDLFTFLRPEFGVAFSSALIISASSLLNMAVGLNAGIITMSRNFRFDSASSLLLLVSNAILNWFLIRWLGISGAAWSTLVSLIMVLIVRVWFLWSRFRLWPYSRKTVIIPLIVLVIGLPLLEAPMSGIPWLDILLRGVIVTVVYWSMMFWLKIAPDLSERAIAILRGHTSRQR
ncbi:MAG: polysaccharide biosynthesis protein [Flavobacteriales bacterium]|nr:polysaccharide biosynthesis protein [Flavobacteriales bacterium]